MSDPRRETPGAMHGVDCLKSPHSRRGRYLHDADDDRPYYDDGLTYCGRCHAWLPEDMARLVAANMTAAPLPEARERPDGIHGVCWYCMKPGYVYRHSDGYNVSMCDVCRDEALRLRDAVLKALSPAPLDLPALRRLVEAWRARADGPVPTDRAIGIEECADELAALLPPDRRTP